MERSVALDLGKAALALASFATLVWGILQIFGLDDNRFSNLGLVGLFLLALSILTLSLGWALFRLVRSRRAISTEGEGATISKLPEELEKVVRQSYRDRRFLDVVRFGSQLSRPLWLAGRYKERIAIGTMVEEAAALEGMADEQIAALIDDLGWTYAFLGELDRAHRNISRGIDLALSQDDYYAVAKGFRHLSGIADRRDDLTQADSYLQQASEYADKIADQAQRTEMLAGISFARAELLAAARRYDEALSALRDCREKYTQARGQEERLVKLHSRFGEIFLRQNKLPEAQEAFRAGLAEARRLERLDEIALNSLGLGEVSLRSSDKEQALVTLREAERLLNELGMRAELRRARSLIAEAQD